VAQVVGRLPSKCEALEFKPQYHTHTQKVVCGDAHL
jgi:hypothetical protein